MVNQAQGRKKSNFPANTVIPAGAFLDFVLNGVNYKIPKDDFIAALGATGTIVQDGAVAGTPVLDVAGTINNIRNLEDGPGVKASVSAENGITLEHNLAFDTVGAAASGNPTDAQPIFRSILAGSGITVSVVDDHFVIATSGVAASVKTVVVTQLSDFPTPAGSVITLAAATQYLIFNDVNIGVNRFVFSEGSVISGADSSVITLTYTDTGDMFTGNDVSARIDSVTLACASGRVFNMADATNTKIFQMIDMTVSTCDTLGAMSGYAAFQLNNVAFPGVATDGVAFSGTLGTFVGRTILAGVGGGAMFDLGTAVIGNFSLDGSKFELAAGTFAVDGLVDSGNIAPGGIGTLLNNRFDGDGTPLNNISTDDALWLFSLNNDIQDSRPDGLLSMQGNATDTVITVTSTAVLAAGTWVVEDVSQMTGTTAGRITYNGEKPLEVPVTASVTVSFTGGGTKAIAAYIAINGGVVANSKRIVSVSSGTAASITIPWQVTFANDDFVEVFIANDSDTTNILVPSAILRVN